MGLFPCNECTKVIIQAGIKEIIFLSDKYADSDSVKASKLMLDISKTKYRQFTSETREVSLQLFTTNE